MPVELDAMRPAAHELVGDREQEAFPVVLELSTVADRIGEAAIAIMTRDEPFARPGSSGGLERFDGGARVIEPEKAPGRPRLIEPVDADGVVRARPAEVAPPPRVAVVGERSGIDEQRLPRGTQGERERIRMTVRRDREVSERTRIGDDFHLAGSVEGIAEKIVAALREEPRQRQVRRLDRSISREKPGEALLGRIPE